MRPARTNRISYGSDCIQRARVRPTTESEWCPSNRPAPGYDGLNFLPSAPGRGRPHPSIASEPTRKYPPFSNCPFCGGSKLEVLLRHCAVFRPMATWRGRKPPSVSVVEDAKNRIWHNAVALQFHQKELRLPAPFPSRNWPRAGPQAESRRRDMPFGDHACERFTEWRRGVRSGVFRRDGLIGCDGHQRNNALTRVSQSATRLPLRHRVKGIHRFGNLLG